MDDRTPLHERQRQRLVFICAGFGQSEPTSIERAGTGCKALNPQGGRKFPEASPETNATTPKKLVNRPSIDHSTPSQITFQTETAPELVRGCPEIRKTQCSDTDRLTISNTRQPRQQLLRQLLLTRLATVPATRQHRCSTTTRQNLQQLRSTRRQHR